MTLSEKIKNKTAVVSILGLGHVGYPLLQLFNKSGFSVVGYDVDLKKLDAIKKGNISAEGEYLPNEEFSNQQKNYELPGKIMVSNDKKILNGCDIFIVTVPTPLKENDTPNLSFLENTCGIIADALKPDTMVIIESTVYPGATEEVAKPLLEKNGMVAGKDFYLCFSPERIDPANQKWKIENIPKVVGGINEKSGEMGALLYSKIVEKVVPVSSIRVAESCKMLENLFRSVNIALINDLAKCFERMGIDTWEVVRAASTKPFGFLPHYPSPGVGGHCIPKDPYYLLYKARKEGLDLQFVELSADINKNMPIYVISVAKRLLEKNRKKLKGAHVGVLGVSYKKNIADIRRTPAKTVIEELLKDAKEVIVHDPLAKETFGAIPGDLKSAISNKDIIILLTDHDSFKDKDLEKQISKLSPNCCVLDTRNFLKPELLDRNISFACIGKPF